MTITIKVSSVQCPKCGAVEEHPDGKHILIRAFKVEMGDGHWWSQCLVCAGYYNPDLTVKEGADAPGQKVWDRDKGWF